MLSLAIFLFSFNALASRSADIQVRLHNRDFVLAVLPERRLTISKFCIQPDGSTNCEAADRLAKVAGMRVRPGTPPDVGGELCVLSGGVLTIGQQTKGDLTVCYFAKDQSVIDVGSLYSAHQRPKK